MEYDLHNNVFGESALNSGTISTNTTTAGPIIDTSGIESLEFFIQAGTITDGSYTVLLEEGDDSGLSDAQAVPAENRLGALPSFANTDDNAVKRVGSISKKRYQRLSLVSVGVTAGGVFAALAVKGHPKTGPTAAQA